MDTNIDSLYLEIAERVSDAIDESWDTAVIDFKYFGGAGEYTGRYTSDDFSGEKDFKVGYKNYKSLKRIHEITTEGGSNMWNKALFTLQRSGEFSIDFEWDQALADEIEANS
jgi:hypothetical protein